MKHDNRVGGMSMKHITKIVAAGLLVFMLSGCGANYVAINKDLGLQRGKEPVVGVLVAGFVVNTETNPMGALLGVKYGEEVTQSLKDLGVDAKVVMFSETLSHKQLATAVGKYNAIPSVRKRVGEGFEFGDLREDFKDLGIDMLVIISGSAGNASTPAWVQLGTFAAFGAMAMVTPSAENIVTTMNREGKPIYNDRTIFTRMGRRDFGNDGHRKAMAEAIADDIREKSL